jgi:hypothetical protein
MRMGYEVQTGRGRAEVCGGITGRMEKMIMSGIC